MAIDPTHNNRKTMDVPKKFRPRRITRRGPPTPPISDSARLLILDELSYMLRFKKRCNANFQQQSRRVDAGQNVKVDPMFWLQAEDDANRHIEQLLKQIEKL